MGVETRVVRIFCSSINNYCDREGKKMGQCGGTDLNSMCTHADEFIKRVLDLRGGDVLEFTHEGDGVTVIRTHSQRGDYVRGVVIKKGAFEVKRERDGTS